MNPRRTIGHPHPKTPRTQAIRRPGWLLGAGVMVLLGLIATPIVAQDGAGTPDQTVTTPQGQLSSSSGVSQLSSESTPRPSSESPTESISKSTSEFAKSSQAPAPSPSPSLAEEERVTPSQTPADPEPAPPLTEALRELTLFLQKGWAEQALQRVHQLEATREGQSSAALQVLKADACYQLLKIACAYDALLASAHLAYEEDDMAGSQMHALLDARVGQLTLYYPAVTRPKQRTIPQISPEVQPLDPHMATLLERTLTAIEGFNRSRKVDEDLLLWRNPQTHRPANSARRPAIKLVLYLPTGTYHSPQGTFEIEPGGTTIIRLESAPVKLVGIQLTLGGLLSVGGYGKEDSPLGMSTLGISILGPGLGIRGEACATQWSTRTLEDGSTVGGQRSCAFVEALGAIKLGERFSIQPGIGYLWMTAPYQPYTCVARASGDPEGRPLTGTCFVEALARGPAGDLRLGMHLLKSRAWLIQLETRMALLTSNPSAIEGENATVFFSLTSEGHVTPLLMIGMKVGRQF